MVAPQAVVARDVEHREAAPGSKTVGLRTSESLCRLQLRDNGERKTLAERCTTAEGGNRALSGSLDILRVVPTPFGRIPLLFDSREHTSLTGTVRFFSVSQRLCERGASSGQICRVLGPQRERVGSGVTTARGGEAMSFGAEQSGSLVVD